MINKLKIFFKKFIFILVVFALLVSPAMAQLTPPHPFVDFGAIFGIFLPVCLNGGLVLIITPVPLVLLFPYVPITPIVPVGKPWGPIPDSTTLGDFLPGGVCIMPPIFLASILGIFSLVPLPIPVFGTLVQIGTTLIPTTYVPFKLL